MRVSTALILTLALAAGADANPPADPPADPKLGEKGEKADGKMGGGKGKGGRKPPKEFAWGLNEAVEQFLEGSDSLAAWQEGFPQFLDAFEGLKEAFPKAGAKLDELLDKFAKFNLGEMTEEEFAEQRELMEAFWKKLCGGLRGEKDLEKYGEKVVEWAAAKATWLAQRAAKIESRVEAAVSKLTGKVAEHLDALKGQEGFAAAWALVEEDANSLRANIKEEAAALVAASQSIATAVEGATAASREWVESQAGPLEAFLEELAAAVPEGELRTAVRDAASALKAQAEAQDGPVVALKELFAALRKADMSDAVEAVFDQHSDLLAELKAAGKTAKSEVRGLQRELRALIRGMHEKFRAFRAKWAPLMKALRAAWKESMKPALEKIISGSRRLRARRLSAGADAAKAVLAAGDEMVSDLQAVDETVEKELAGAVADAAAAADAADEAEQKVADAVDEEDRAGGKGKDGKGKGGKGGKDGEPRGGKDGKGGEEGEGGEEDSSDLASGAVRFGLAVAAAAFL